MKFKTQSRTWISDKGYWAIVKDRDVYKICRPFLSVLATTSSFKKAKKIIKLVYTTKRKFKDIVEEVNNT